jgi:hypothetical protein
MKATPKPTQLRARDVEALAEFWMIFWAATALNPGNCRSYRGTMASLGLVEKRGALALTPSGKRVMKFMKTQRRRR